MTIRTNFLLTICLCCIVYCSHAGTPGKAAAAAAPTELSGTRWKIKKQSFASHDAKGTDIDSIIGKKGDFIIFQNDGHAYCYFDNKHDTLQYKMIGPDSITFGDTPFAVRSLSANSIELYQNEEESNGDYNRIWFILEKN